jgi:membrane protease subunit HflK
MTEQDKENDKDLRRPVPEKSFADEFDAAGKSLSEALKTSFIILKIIMIVLVVAFLASGFKTVSSDEQALVLRFGRIQGVGEERLLGPGLHWIFPYPIDEMVKIPTAKKVNLAIGTFWYYQTEAEILGEGPKRRERVPEKLDPVKDGYCLTRSEAQENAPAGSDGSDYNIVHSKWQLTYQINDPERFFKNAYVEDVEPGEIYFDVITRSIRPFLEDIIEDAVVTAMVNYTIDEAIESQDRIPKHVRRLMQERLDQIESGIRVVSVYLIDITWPRQVDSAFQASIEASQKSQRAISEARTYAENALSQAGGPMALELLSPQAGKTIQYLTEEQKTLLWSQLAGAAQEKIAVARAYRTSVVENARANADYLREILPEYRKRPRLVIQKIYQDAIEYVLNNTDEKFIIQPTKGAENTEIRVLLNRDQTLKPK